MKSITPFMTRIPGVPPSMLAQMTNTAWLRNEYQEMLSKVKVQVPSGWLPLVMSLMEDLAALRDSQSEHQFFITCLECRDGTLHVELDTPSSSTQAVIEEYQLRSTHTCQACSAPGYTHEISGEIFTYCRICAFIKDADAIDEE